MDDTLGNVMPSTDRGCSLFRGTCPGAVEKRIRGIVPPNYDIVGATIYGGLRYCQQAATFSTNKHYYQESDIMMVGQSCINDVKMFTKVIDTINSIKQELIIAGTEN